MEPLKPRAKEELLKKPQASPQDVEEYEKLLSARFTTDPNPDPRIQPVAAPSPAAVGKSSETRLKDLYKKLYGKVP